MARFLHSLQEGFANEKAKIRIFATAFTLAGAFFGYQKGLYQAAKDNEHFST